MIDYIDGYPMINQVSQIEELKWIKVNSISKAPKGPGVYMMKASGDLTYSCKYIGSSSRLYRRIIENPIIDRDNYEIYAHSCDTKLQAHYLESRLIEILDPPLNRRGGRNMYMYGRLPKDTVHKIEQYWMRRIYDE